MRYTVRKSYIDVIGNIWMPSSGIFAYRYDLSLYDVEDIVKPINRDNVQDWLDKNAGDFSRVHDFSASIENGDETIDIPWIYKESEMTFCDCVYGDEDCDDPFDTVEEARGER